MILLPRSPKLARTVRILYASKADGHQGQSWPIGEVLVQGRVNGCLRIEPFDSMPLIRTWRLSGGASAKRRANAGATRGRQWQVPLAGSPSRSHEFSQTISYLPSLLLPQLVWRCLGSGAGDGNRTHVSSLGSCSSTIELHPRRGRDLTEWRGPLAIVGGEARCRAWMAIRVLAGGGGASSGPCAWGSGRCRRLALILLGSAYDPHPS